MTITGYKGANLGALDKLALPTAKGTYGKGYYFGDFNCAKEYADDGYILEATISISKPIHYIAAYDERTDNYAVKLIEQIFDRDTKKHMSELLSADYNYLGRNFQRGVINLGYTGIIVDYGNKAFECIALYECSIKPQKLTRIGPDQQIIHDIDLSELTMKDLGQLLKTLKLSIA